MKFRTHLAAPLMALFVSSAPAPSLAACDGCVVNAVNTANSAIVSAINTMTNAIVNALRGSTQTLAEQQAKSAELLAQSQQRTNTQMETERQEARFAVPDACAVVAASRGLQDAVRGTPSMAGGVGRGGGGGARSASGGVTQEMQRALDISAGRVPAPSPEQQASLAAAGACNSFASGAANPVRGQSCQLAGFSANASNGHPDADIRAETLLDGPQRASTAGGFKRKLTVDPDGAERQAVEAYLRNLSVPVDFPQLSKAELARPAGRQYIAYRDAFEARIALAEKPAKQMAQNRVASAALLPVIRQLLASEVTGPFVKEYLDKAYPNWATRGVSVDEMMTLESERRYLNKEWHAKMAGLPPEAHVKEQTTMMAFQVMQMQRIADKLDLIAVVMGQGAATQVRQEMVPQLVQLHAQASR